MQISDIVNQLNQQTSAAGGMTSAPVAAEGYAEGNRTLSGLIAGEVFEGTVMDVENGKVTISLANGSNISARLDSGVSLTQGAATFFQVKSNEGGQIALKAVTQDNFSNPTLVRALTQAGVQVSVRNLDLVKEMMNQQLPIDSKNLLSMVRVANSFPDTGVSTLTQLQKLSIPINELNIEQLEQYNRGQGQIQRNLEDIMKALPELIREANGQSEGLNVAKQILSMFVEETSAKTGQKETTGGVQQPMENAEQTQESASGTGQTRNAISISGQTQESPGSPGQETAAGRMADGGQVQDTVGNAKEGSENAARIDLMTEQTSGTSGKDAPGMNSAPTDVGADSSAHMEMNTSLSMPAGNESIKGSDPATQLAQIIEWIDKGQVTKEELSELFGKRDFQDLLQNTVTKQWFLDPEQVQDKQKLEELYERIDRQMSKLQDIFAQAGQKDSPITRQISDTKSNISFLNQINQYYNYVQIPLRMANQNATGDLYVYTNRKSIGKRDGELSAHLHLEMEHLGTTDVFVKLNNKKLSTNFVLEDEKSLDLVMEHIDILTKRLQKKGYDINVQVKEKPDTEQKAMFFQEVLGQQQPQQTVVSRYSFDVKV